MNALAQERILLIGDHDRQIHSALGQVLPSADVTMVPSYFDAIADMAGMSYTTVLAAVAPIERRPEAAVRNLRQVAGESRLLLFGNPGYEPLARKMLDFGLDDYIVTPINPTELQQMFGAPPLRLSASPPPEGRPDAPIAVAPLGRLSLLHGLPLADILVDAIVQQPGAAVAAALLQINARIGPAMQLILRKAGEPSRPAPEGSTILTHTTAAQDASSGNALSLVIPRDEDEITARHLLARLIRTLNSVTQLEERHRRLTKMAFTDDLTGLYNGRFFWHELDKRIAEASEKVSLATLLLFDIDNFKSYNDRFGHGIGDEILKQTAQLIRTCCREHDHVARVSGDEFAVIFSEKEGPRQPRQPRDPNSTAAPVARVPQTIVHILERFRHAIATSDLKMLGAHGKGVLSISGGLAVYPHHGTTAQELYNAADKALMFGAKRGGKNSIFLVGSGDTGGPTG